MHYAVIHNNEKKKKENTIQTKPKLMMLACWLQFIYCLPVVSGTDTTKCIFVSFVPYNPKIEFCPKSEVRTSKIAASFFAVHFYFSFHFSYIYKVCTPTINVHPHNI